MLRSITIGTATADDLGVKALDDKTLEITLIQPTSYFIDILSMWTFSPVQKATVEANGDKWSTEADTYICNGPFKIASMSMNENVILEKNENYWMLRMSPCRRSPSATFWIRQLL